jgi:5-methylcytosine-specific restriction enzyme subunit McrC
MIKIQNIYHMLAYAFQVLKKDGYAKLATEEFTHVCDLLAAILAKGLANQIKRGLGKGYVSKVEPLRLPAGKINVSASVKAKTVFSRQLVCEFDEYTENIYLNKILKTTSHLLIRAPEVAIQQKKALKKVIHYFSNVDVVNPGRVQWSNIRFHRNNATYKMLINICYLVITGMLITEQDGSRQLARFIDDQHMHRLYEKFVLEYYRKHYPQLNACAAHIDWHVDDGFVDFLPTMKTDITLTYGGKTIIIDTKYYKQIMQGGSLHDSWKIHSQNMYQIFAYVKNWDVANSGTVSGILLYAKTDEKLVPNHDYMLNGNRISVKTLDLNADFSEIRLQLHRLVSDLLN